MRANKFVAHSKSIENESGFSRGVGDKSDASKVLFKTGTMDAVEMKMKTRSVHREVRVEDLQFPVAPRQIIQSLSAHITE